MHRRDLALLEKLQAFFKGAGGISKTKRTTLQYRVTSVEQISNVIIPHFDKYSLITQKLADYPLKKGGYNHDGKKRTFNSGRA